MILRLGSQQCKRAGKRCVDSVYVGVKSAMSRGNRLQLKVFQGDITSLDVDAIVNAANEGLKGGAGVDGAIHRAAGAELLVACRKLGHCPTGEARITEGFELKARYVVHTVGPIWAGGTAGEDELLRSCYRASITQAIDHGLRTIAFPCISTGIYGFPFERARDIAIGAVRVGLQNSDAALQVTFCCFSEDDYQSYVSALN